MRLLMKLLAYVVFAAVSFAGVAEAGYGHHLKGKRGIHAASCHPRGAGLPPQCDGGVKLK